MTSQKINKNTIAIGSVLFTALYIFAELTFNLGLVDFLNSKNTEMDTFKSLETFGRLLSSVGVGLLVVKLACFIYRKINKQEVIETSFKAVVFMLTAIVFYLGQTSIFNSILNNMSQEQSLNAYAFGVYRNLNLNNQINLKVLKNENKEYDDVIVSMLGVLTTNPNLEKEVTNSVKSFFYAENNLDQKLIGRIYDEMQFKMPNVDKYWGIYAVESRRYESYNGYNKESYRKKFQEQIGMPPSLSKKEFENRLKSKMMGDKSSLNSIVIVPANEALKMKSLKIGDIPEGLNRKSWINYVNNHINSALEKSRFKKENVHSLPHSREIISSVVITPIAVIISMIALFLNICTLITSLSAPLGKLAVIPGVLTAGLFALFINNWSYNPYHLNENLNKLIGSETKLVKMFNGYRGVIHNMFVNDNNPNQYQLIRLEKPKMPDMSNMKADLDAKFASLKKTGDIEDISQVKILDKAAEQIKVDINELEKNKYYYGELNKKNPYVK